MQTKSGDLYYAYTDENYGFSPGDPDILMSGYPFKKAEDSVYKDTQALPKVIPCGWTADKMFFLGMINSFDEGNGDWYIPVGLERRQNFFIGDDIGEIDIVYEDDPYNPVVIPLKIGFTAFWYDPWLPDQMEPFKSDLNNARAAVKDSMYLNGLGLHLNDPKEQESYYLAYPRKG